MKISNSLIAAAVVALLPLSAIAGDGKTASPMSSDKSSAQFDTLDTDRDGRLSRTEAASDAKITFTTADRNGDGYLDGSEYMHRDAAKESMPDSGNQPSDTQTPRQ